jgi:hypothetical protein
MPERVGPHVKLVFAEMARLHFTYDEVEEGSGVRRASIKAWRRKNRPGLESLEAVLGFLGWKLCPVPSLEALPADTAGALVAFAKRLEQDIPTTWAALIDICTQQKLLKMRADERAAILAEHDARRSHTSNDNMPRRRRKPKSPANDNQRDQSTAA